MNGMEIPLFYFTCYQTSTYFIQIFQTNLKIYIVSSTKLIKQNNILDQPKFILEFDHKNQINWIQNGMDRFDSFGFEQNGKFRIFQSDHITLMKFKDCLSAKIFQKGISLFYDPICLIGSGVTSKVYKMFNRIENIFYATKCIKKEYIFHRKDQSRYVRMLKEIQLLDSMNHPNIINLKEIFESKDTYYIVQQYCPGETLFSFINDFKHNQILSIHVIKQILTGLAYMQEYKIIHFDIKPENIMIVYNESELSENQTYYIGNKKQTFSSLEIKIIDFGLARQEEIHQNFCGTAGYIAPEIFLAQITGQYSYNYKVDVFSAGSILFKMLTGKSLYSSSPYQSIIENNKQNVSNIDLMYDENLNLSKDVIQLIKGLLQDDPSERLSAIEALNLPIFKVLDDQHEQNLQELIDDDQLINADDDSPMIFIPITFPLKKVMQSSKDFSQDSSDMTYTKWENYQIIDGEFQRKNSNPSYVPSFCEKYNSKDLYDYILEN